MTATIPFVAFTETVLGVRLTRAQRVLALVAFDGVEPQDLTGSDRDAARCLFGDVDTIPPEARGVLVAVCGARGGKSYLLSALYSLWRMLTADLSTLAHGEQASAVVVAPDLRLARQVLRYALGAARAVPAIARCIESETTETLVLRRPDGAQVALECLPATRGGSALRGRSLVSAVLDESAFFRSEEYQVNDAELFRAVAPRVMPGGMVVIASTPWIEAGLLHEEFSRNHGHPLTALACHAPTLLLRDGDPTIAAMVARERERDPDNAAREFDAQFMPGGAGLYFDPSALAAAVDRDRPIELAPIAGARRSAAADFGFVSDSSALVVVQSIASVAHVSAVTELRPRRGLPLQPSAVVAAFAEEVRRYGLAQVVSDVHYREAIREHLAASKLTLRPTPDGSSGKLRMYSDARAMLHEGRVRLPYHPRLLQQLREVTSRPTTGGGLTITSPRRSAGGGHGDLVSALVAALWAVRDGREGFAGLAIPDSGARVLEDPLGRDHLPAALPSRLHPLLTGDERRRRFLNEG